MHVSFTLTVLFKFKYKYLLVGVPISSGGSADIVTISWKCQNIDFIDNTTENDKAVMHGTYAGIQQICDAQSVRMDANRRRSGQTNSIWEYVFQENLRAYTWSLTTNEGEIRTLYEISNATRGTKT